MLPQIARLSLQGHTSREIAAKLGVPKTTLLRWRDSLRRECATRSVTETMEMIDNVADCYKRLYRKALRGWDRSLADKEIRIVTDNGDDDAEKKRTVRTETQAGNPAYLGQARAALDSLRKLKGLDMPAEAEIEAAEDEPIELEGLKQDDLARMSDAELRAVVAQCEEALDSERLAEKTRDEESAGIHELHEAGLPGELAPREAGGEAGPGGDGADQAADGLHAAAARQERVGEPPLPGLPAGPESRPAADRQLAHQRPGHQPEPRRAADHDQRCLRGGLSPDVG